VLVSLATSLTLAPAVPVVGSRFGLLEPQTQDGQAGLAADRGGDRSVARADPDRHAGARLRRTGRAVLLQGELRRQPVHAGQCANEPS
jgi:hypothetical protein